MGIIASMIVHTAGKLPGAQYLAKWEWGSKAFHGLATTTILGTGTALGYYNYGHTYGNGTAALYGIASTYPITAVPLALIESGKILGDSIYNKQQSKRSVSFAKSRINDRFGTINMMRQYSGQQLRRDHSSARRILGNEAVYLHR